MAAPSMRSHGPFGMVNQKISRRIAAAAWQLPDIWKLAAIR
jgi:hypothetical protein